MPAATFLGTASLAYPQYLDTDPEAGGTTLVAEPLNTYQITVADQWNISVPPGDGLWGPVPRGVLSFTITPGSAVIGGMSPGQPGFTPAPEAMEAVLAEPAVRVPVPAARVVRGRIRKLRPAPARRPARRRELAGAGRD